MQPIRLVVGLGNPGREHAATRHNAGFWFVDALAASLGAKPQRGEVPGRLRRAGRPPPVEAGYLHESVGQVGVGAGALFAIDPDDIPVVHEKLIPPEKRR
jgi:PTH1 family peptidyl-tRNA hydrolase